MKTEYKVVPAPERARKVRGLKGPALFALAMEDLMNEMAADGWQYLRTDTLPHEERSGLTSKVTTYRNLLVFQRVVIQDVVEEVTAPAPVRAASPTPAAEVADNDDVTNLWHAEDEGPDGANAPLIADRQGQRVDL